MTSKHDPELRAMRAIDRALEGLPKDAQFRALAYFVAKIADVATNEASEWLYAEGAKARAQASEIGGGSDADG